MSAEIEYNQPVSEEKRPPWQIMLLMVFQSSVFVAVGLLLNMSLSSEAARELCSTELSFPFDPALNGVIAASIVLGTLLVADMGLSAVLLAKSEGYRAADAKAAQDMSMLLELPKPALTVSLIAGALGEEMLFRFGLFPALTSLGLFIGAGSAPSVAAAVIASSLVFSIAHGQYGNPWQVFQVGIAGVACCFGYMMCGSVIAIAAAHFVSNMVTILWNGRKKTSGSMSSSPDEDVENNFH